MDFSNTDRDQTSVVDCRWLQSNLNKRRCMIIRSTYILVLRQHRISVYICLQIFVLAAWALLLRARRPASAICNLCKSVCRCFLIMHDAGIICFPSGIPRKNPSMFWHQQHCLEHPQCWATPFLYRAQAQRKVIQVMPSQCQRPKSSEFCFPFFCLNLMVWYCRHSKVQRPWNKTSGDRPCVCVLWDWDCGFMRWFWTFWTWNESLSCSRVPDFVGQILFVDVLQGLSWCRKAVSFAQLAVTVARTRGTFRRALILQHKMPDFLDLNLSLHTIYI